MFFGKSNIGSGNQLAHVGLPQHLSQNRDQSLGFSASVANSISAKYGSSILQNFPGLRSLDQEMRLAPDFRGNREAAFCYMKAAVCGNESIKKSLASKLKSSSALDNDFFGKVHKAINEKNAGLNVPRGQTHQRIVWDSEIKPFLYAKSIEEAQVYKTRTTGIESYPLQRTVVDGRFRIHSPDNKKAEVDKLYKIEKDQFFNREWNNPSVIRRWSHVKGSVHLELNRQVQENFGRAPSSFTLVQKTVPVSQTNLINQLYDEQKRQFFNGAYGHPGVERQWMQVKGAVHAKLTAQIQGNDSSDNAHGSCLARPSVAQYQRPWEMDANYRPGIQNGQYSVRPKRSNDQAFNNPIRTVKDASKMLTEVLTFKGPVTCFYEPDSPFSNWHHSPFSAPAEEFKDPDPRKKDHNYTCMEQFLFVQKFRALGMHDVARKIKETPDPEQQKIISQSARVDADELQQKWFGRTQKNVLSVGINAKFSDSRNQDLLHTLLLTKGEIIEAAGNDRIYGAGAAVSDLHGMQRIKDGSWRQEIRRGSVPKNLLGKALQNFRDSKLETLASAARQTLIQLENDYQPEIFR